MCLREIQAISHLACKNRNFSDNFQSGKPIIVYPAWDKPLFRDKSARDMTSAQTLCG